MKYKILFFFVFLYSFPSQSQIKPILYGGAEYYRDVGFKQNAYINFNVGAQLFHWKFLAPEIGFEHFYGLSNEVEKLHSDDPQARSPEKFSTRFTTNHFSIAPKMIFGNEEAALVIIPQYNFGKISGRGDLLQDNGREYFLHDRQRISQSVSFWSFAAGVEGQFYDSEVLHFGLLLKYHFLDSEEALEQLSFEDHGFTSEGGSSGGLGISFRIYFDFLQLLK